MGWNVCFFQIWYQAIAKTVDEESTNSVPEENENDKEDVLVANVWDNQRDQDEEANDERKVRARVGSPWDYFFMLTCIKYVLLDITRH